MVKVSHNEANSKLISGVEPIKNAHDSNQKNKIRYILLCNFSFEILSTFERTKK